MNEPVILINQGHDLRGEVMQFANEFMQVRIAQGHTVQPSEFILAIFRGKQIVAKVIGVQQDQLHLLIPSLPERYFEDRRHFPRILVQFPAVILPPSPNGVRNGDSVIRVQIHDIGHQGVSYSVVEEAMAISSSLQIGQLVIQHESLPITCEIEVLNQVEQFGRKRYGATFRYIANSDVRLLYHFLFMNRN